MAIRTKTTLCNLALSEIAAPLLNDFDADQTPEGRLCRLHYQPTLESLLRDHPWSFATRTITLFTSEAAPPYSHGYPPDCLRLIETIPNGILTTIEGTNIVTDSNPITFRYITSSPPETEWDALFSEAFVYLLASRIAPPLTANPIAGDAALNKFAKLSLPNAKHADASEERYAQANLLQQTIRNSFLTRARFNRR